MKKIITTFVLAGSLVAGPTVFAEENGTTSDAGLTPDSVWYLFDDLGENLQLLFTVNNQKESHLLLDFAQERLAESEQMIAEGKEEYINQLIDAYIAKVNSAQELISEVIVSEEVQEEEKEYLVIDLESVITNSSSIDENLDKDLQEKVTSINQEAFLVANVVKDLDLEKVKFLRDAGLGFGQIVKVIVLAEESGKTEEEILALIKDQNKGFGELAKELNLSLSDMVEEVLDRKEDLLEDAIEEAEELGNKEALEKLTIAMANVQKKKQEFKIIEEYVEIEEEIKEELLELEKELKAGEITKEEYEKELAELRAEVEEDLLELKDELEEEERERLEELAKEERESQEELVEKERERAEEEQGRNEELAEEERERAEEEREKQEELAKKERERKANRDKDDNDDKDEDDDDDDEDADDDNEDSDD